MEIVGKIELRDKIIMFLFLLASANPFIKENIEIVTVFLLLLIFILYPKVLKFDFNKEIGSFITILFFVSFEFLHQYLFNLDNSKTIIRIIGYYLLAYFIVKALQKKFIIVFVKIMSFYAILSLVFVLVSYFYNLNLLYNNAWVWFPVTTVNNPTIIIYTFDHMFYTDASNILRNAGFTWEAGGFATYVNLALFFHIITNKFKIIDIFKDKVSILFILTIISTFSTTGYGALFFILLVTSISERGLKKYFFASMLILVMILSFNRFSFLGEKIEEQIELADESQNRFGSALLDLKDIVQRPLTGWSRKGEVLFGNDAFTYVSHRPNGITNLIRSYGFIYFFVLLVIWYKAFINYFDFWKIKTKRYFALSLIVVILILAFSQLILNQLLFLSFLFLSIYFKKQKVLLPNEVQ